MKKAQIVSFHCVLKDKIGNIISSTFNHDVITRLEDHDGSEDFLKGLAEGLQDLKKGERRRIFLPADQAYGFYDPRLVVELPRRIFERGKAIQIGHEVQTLSQAGDLRFFKVVAATSDMLTLDGNHPLAGQDLIFEIEATDARDASIEELEEASCVTKAPVLH
jgi:FKBP-type peptidyl-prolyl cis-trans isomerase SlyD